MGRTKTCEKWAVTALIFFAGWLFVVLPLWHSWEGKWDASDVIAAISAISALAMAVLTYFLVKLNDRLANRAQK